MLMLRRRQLRLRQRARYDITFTLATPIRHFFTLSHDDAATQPLLPVIFIILPLFHACRFYIFAAPCRFSLLMAFVYAIFARGPLR